MANGDGPAVSANERRILRDVLAPFADRIDTVAVFGSRALGTQRPASDIDLVIHGTLDDAAVARIWSLLDQSSLAVTVDVVRYDDLYDAALRRHIDGCAKVLFDREELSVAGKSSAPAARYP